MVPASHRFGSVATLNAGRSVPRGDGRHALRASSERYGSAVIVRVGGEVDASNQDVWRNLLAKMASSAIAPGPFVVDVRQMHFMGCGAFLELAQEARRCHRREVSMCLVSHQPIVAHIVAAAGLRPLLTMYRTVETALSATTPEHCDR